MIETKQLKTSELKAENQHRSTNLKKRKKPKKKTLKRKMDILWSEIIRSKGRCEICGKTDNLQAHHVIGRINLALRWDIKNGVCLCSSCHTFGKTSSHNNPVFFLDWFKTHRPQDYEYLLKKKNETKTFHLSDYEEIYEILSKTRKRL